MIPVLKICCSWQSTRVYFEGSTPSSSTHRSFCIVSASCFCCNLPCCFRCTRYTSDACSECFTAVSHLSVHAPGNNLRFSSPHIFYIVSACDPLGSLHSSSSPRPSVQSGNQFPLLAFRSLSIGGIDTLDIPSLFSLKP